MPCAVTDAAKSAMHAIATAYIVVRLGYEGRGEVSAFLMAHRSESVPHRDNITRRWVEHYISLRLGTSL